MTLAIVLALTLALATQAMAAPGWLASEPLSPDGYIAVNARVAVDAAGSATAVWEQKKIGQIPSTIQWSSRPAGGEWQPAQTLDDVGAEGGSPGIAAIPTGETLAIWRDHSGPTAVLRSAFRPASGAWQPAQTIDSGDVAAPFRLAVDASGNAVALWKLGGKVRAAGRSAGPGTWSSPQNLAVAEPDHQVSDPHLAINAAGDAVAVWRLSSSDEQIVQASVRPAAGGPWQDSQDLSPSNHSAIHARVSIDAAGNALAVWSDTEKGIANEAVIRAARRPGGGSWQPAETISDSAASALVPHVAMAADGAAVAVWTTTDENGKRLFQAADRSPTGAWGAPQPLLLADQANFGQLVVNPSGAAVATWSRSDGANFIVQAVNRPAGGAWSAPHDLSATGQDASSADTAIDPRGDAVAIWTRNAGTPAVAVQAAVYDSSTTALTPATPPSTTTTTSTAPAAASGPEPPRRYPVVLMTISKNRSLRTLLARGLKVPVSSSDACTLRVRLLITAASRRRLHLSSRVLASVTTKLGAAGKTTVVLRLSRRTRTRLRHTRKLNLAVQTFATDLAGNTVSASRALHLRR